MAQPNSANDELLHRGICFSDRVPVITGTGEIRIRESDPTVRTIAQDVAWRGLAVDAEEGRAQGSELAHLLGVAMVSVVVSIQMRKMFAEMRKMFLNARHAEQDVRERQASRNF